MMLADDELVAGKQHEQVGEPGPTDWVLVKLNRVPPAPLRRWVTASIAATSATAGPLIPEPTWR